MKPLRLLVFLEATTVTGPAKNLLQFAQLAGLQDIQTTIAVFRRANDSTVFQKAAEAAGLSLAWIEERGRFDTSVLPAMAALTRRVRPDIVQTHAVKGHFLARRAGLDKLAPWVAFHHGYTWTDWRVLLYNQLDRWSLRTARRIVTVSGPFVGELQGLGIQPDRIQVLHNAIDPQWGQGRDATLRAKLKIPAAAPVLLLVGRFSQEKDHAGLLDAMAELREYPHLHLVLVGDGPDKPRIEAQASALGLASRVIFTGQVPSAEPYYGIADVAVLNSRTEGSPNALLEAMAAGVPVAATAVGGIPEIVTHRESALLTQPGDSRGMAASIRELLGDAALRTALVEKAHRLVEQRHSPQARTAQLAALYRGLLYVTR